MISILIPVYHNHKFAFDAIRSSLYHSKKIEKIYIFDDNPLFPLKKSDKTNLLQHKKIIYKINDKNLGRIKSYNKLVKSCASDFFIMLDGDDLLSRDIDFDFIQAQLIADKNIFLVVGLCKEFNTQTGMLYSTLGARKFGKIIGLKLLYDWIGSKNLLPHSASIFNTKIVKNLGLYSESINNPEILLARKVLMQSNVLSLNCIFSFWRKHNKNTSVSFELDSILDEFKSTLQVYDHLKVHSEVLRHFWLIKSVIFYLISSFHIIFSKTNSFNQVLIFYKRFTREYAVRNFIIFISSMFATPKILALFTLPLLFSKKRFRAYMISRKVWLYDTN